MNTSKRLVNYLNEMSNLKVNYLTVNKSVSNSTVGWQIDHALKVINSVITALQDAPTNKSAKLTMVGRLCLFTRHIPRGKGKAPKQVQPPEVIELDAIEKQLLQAKECLQLIPVINSKATFKHPYFGILNKNQTIKFVEIHTKHHLKIMRDILK